MLKKILLGLGAALLLLVVVIVVFVGTKLVAFNSSMAKVYDVPLPTVTLSAEPAVLARGKHLAESLGSCFECHGAGGVGGKRLEMGPIGLFVMPNITAGKNGALAAYNDGELARLVKHGLRKDGTSVRFMPSQDFAWWPQSDVDALVSYLRTVPSLDGAPPLVELGLLGKVLDRMDAFTLDVARRIDHASLPQAPTPAPTKEYGKVLAQLCQGCHGQHLSGGPIPGAPATVPTPLNLTPHESGMKGWTYDDFAKAMRTGTRKNGRQIDPFMPMATMAAMDDTELQALWAHLSTIPAFEFGKR